jgi:amino acid transporter
MPRSVSFSQLVALSVGITVCGALSVAELAGALPRSGGVFAYLLEAYGPLPAFLFGWTELVVIRASALGAIATIFAEYLGYFVPLVAAHVRIAAACAVALIGAINYVGVQRAAAVLSATTAVKYAVLLGLGLLAFTARGGSAAHFVPAWPASAPWSALATALILVMWTYDGWADAAFVAGEVKDPQRNLPLALITGAVCVIVAYLVVNVGFLYALAPQTMADSKLVASTVAARIPLLGGVGAAVVAAAVVISAFSGLNASMLAGSRIFYAMADRRLFFRVAARVSPRFDSPSVAIWLATVLGVAYVLFNDFAELADKFILGIWPFYTLTVAAVFVLRARRPELPRPYRVWGYPIVPAVFLIASLYMVLNALLTDPRNTGITFAIILAGVPVFWLWSSRRGQAMARQP